MKPPRKKAQVDVYRSEVKSSGNKDVNMTKAGAPRLSASNHPRSPSGDFATKPKRKE